MHKRRLCIEPSQAPVLPMPTLNRSIPSLAALVTFEAAARLGGFTAAARELGVTQAAVSRQMRILEDELGAPLFLRAHRRVELTAAGSVLSMAVTRAFDQIGDAIDVIRPPRPSTPPKTLRIGASLAFSHFWLLPRLATFRMMHPDIVLRLVSQDQPLDLRDGTVDVTLRYGKPPFRDGDAVVSFPDRIVPVCSPALYARVAHLPFPQRLFALPRIDAEAHDASWLTWRRWFAAAGLGRLEDGGVLQFNQHTDAVYAAIDDQGVALGWLALLERPLAEGRLVPLTDLSVRPDEAYNLVVPRGALANPAAAAFSDWFGAEVG